MMAFTPVSIGYARPSLLRNVNFLTSLANYARAVSSLSNPRTRNGTAPSVVVHHHLHIIAAHSPSSVELSKSMRTSIMPASYLDVSITAYRPFTTAYQGTPSDGKHNLAQLAHLIPYRTTLKDGRHVEVDFFRHSATDIEEDEWYVGMALMNLVIREGLSWPFEDEFTSVDDWRAYFLSHTAFVVRALDNGMDAARRNSSSPGEVLGCFYIKPNFPGRCSHVCNGGFITAPRFRGLGVGRLMGQVFLRAARDSGYKSR